ncbi:ABC-three component system middle component 2 [Flavobacterium johnsoniae]|uniref:ABC-three component system middle component 2 n=1 Tax=Flavobacterium johnsoniae TaxID=986 RepID=UPI0011EE9EA9|nr:ABC-three component system middle component 2 [Flavobacterium johnsoniae]
MDINKLFENNNLVFNSPLEFSLRCLCIINHEKNQGIDLNKLVYYDYLILNTGDISDLASMHPAIPFRGAQVLVKREVIKQALSLLISKQLIDLKFDNDGIRYYKNDLTSPFVNYLESEYIMDLHKRISWVSEHFFSYKDDELSGFINSNMDKWGGEFIKESIFRNTSNV